MKRPDLLPETIEGKKEKVYEEIGELLQAMGKAGRHGYFTLDPVTKKKYNNKNDILAEARDVIYAIDAYTDELEKLSELEYTIKNN